MLTTPTSLPVASVLPSALALEQVIGEIAADAAVALARALREFQTDELSPGTREHWSTSITRLFELRVYAGQLDFFAVVRARGTRLLRERHGEDLDARTIAVLIDAVIEALRQVVRAELN